MKTYDVTIRLCFVSLDDVHEADAMRLIAIADQGARVAAKHMAADDATSACKVDHVNVIDRDSYPKRA